MESHKVDMKQKICIAYVPMILKGMTEISAALGVSQKTVKEWVEYGAPISMEGEGNNTRYSAELMRLQMWRELRTQNKHI